MSVLDIPQVLVFQFYVDMKPINHDDAGDIEMKRNEIYGQLPQQQVARNPAYNWWYPSSNRH